MYKTRIDKLVTLINENNITAYEIAQNTSLTINGVQKIIDGVTEKPRSRTLDDIENYLNKKLFLVNEAPEHYKTSDSKFYNKDGSPATLKQLSEYVVRNVEMFKEDVAFKNLIDIEALKILLKAKNSEGVVDVDKIG